jgi:hypothetical protein
MELLKLLFNSYVPCPTRYFLTPDLISFRYLYGDFGDLLKKKKNHLAYGLNSTYTSVLVLGGSLGYTTLSRPVTDPSISAVSTIIVQ